MTGPATPGEAIRTAAERVRAAREAAREVSEKIRQDREQPPSTQEGLSAEEGP